MPPHANAALDELYLRVYASTSLFFIHHLDDFAQLRARDGQWPRDHEEFGTMQDLVDTFVMDMCTMLGMSRVTNNASNRNLAKLMTYFQSDKYHTNMSLNPGDSNTLNWRALFAFSSLGDLFLRLFRFNRNNDPGSKEFTFPIPLSNRAFSPTANDSATPFDCEASRYFATVS